MKAMPERTNDDASESLMSSSASKTAAVKETDQSKRTDRFPRHRLAIILFLVPFTLFLILSFVPHIPEIVIHLLLTFSVVTAVHLLDRLVLYQDTEKSLNKLKEGIESHIEGQIESLVESTNSLTKNSLNEIKEGIQSDIAKQTASLEAMTSSGIARIFSTRAEACKDMGRDLTDPNNTCIRIIGISLNDFMRGDQRVLHEAWKTLERYIRGELSVSNQLDIKVLIIDPRCMGAQFRSDSEVRGHDAVPGHLADDVNAVIEALVKLELESKTRIAATGVSFECRLYRLPPILFLCLVDSACYVQQYHFWSARTTDTPIPILKYGRHSEAVDAYPMHAEMTAHFDWIWTRASIEVSDYHEKAVVGVDSGLNECGAVNVYTDHLEAFKRIQWLLENAKKKVSIQGISLHSFFKAGKLFRAISKSVESGQVDLEVLLLDPGCDQAMYRSFRERLFAAPEQTFEQYKQDPEQHKETDLFQDTRRSIENIRRMVSDIARIKKDSQWQLRLAVKFYESAPSCFMLRVDDTVLVEQYHYGNFIPDEDLGHVPVILGKDVPVIEYSALMSSIHDDIQLRSPFRLLKDHFAFVLKHAKQVVP